MSFIELTVTLPVTDELMETKIKDLPLLAMRELHVSPDHYATPAALMGIQTNVERKALDVHLVLEVVK